MAKAAPLRSATFAASDLRRYMKHKTPMNTQNSHIKFSATLGSTEKIITYAVGIGVGLGIPLIIAIIFISFSRNLLFYYCQYRF